MECLYNYYCDSCYKLIHNIKENKNYKKGKIDYFLPIATRYPEHPKILLDLFCIDEKGMFLIYIIKYLIILKLCCAKCCFNNLHKNHKLLSFDGEEALKKENITIEDSSEHFKENKNKIENEMIEINKLYEKIVKEVTSS